MDIPEFLSGGDLPPGIYPVALSEALSRFGIGSAQRIFVANRLERIYRLAKSTGHLARFVIFGSFVTSKTEPRDVDLLLVMDDDFRVDQTTGEAAVVFRHAEADAYFGASIFWSTRSGAFGGEQAMIEYWQTRRDGGKRGILEIVSEAP